MKAFNAVHIALAICRLRRFDPATRSPCAEEAEKALREEGWDLYWAGEDGPRGANDLRVTGRDYESGYYLHKGTP